MNFKPQEYLKEAVESRDIIKIKSAISCYIDVESKNVEEIKNALDYAKKSLPQSIKLVVPHDNIPFKQKGADWTKEYFWGLKADLMENFSQERFDHILEVAKHLYVQKPNNTNVSKIENYPKKPSPSIGGQKTKKNLRVVAVVITVITVGAAILLYRIAARN